MNYRTPYFPPPNLTPPPPKPSINQITLQKIPQSSQYRTHFKLMNIYRPINLTDDQFVVKIAQKLKKYINCDIVQIAEVVQKDRVDLAIGMQNDRDAMIFLLKNQHIKLQAQRGLEETYEPRVSNVFKTYMNAKKHLFPQIASDLSRKQLSSKPTLQPAKQSTNPNDKQGSPSSSQARRSRSSSSSSYSSSSHSSSGQNSKNRTNIIDRSRSKKSPERRSRSRSKSYQRSSRQDDYTLGFSESIKQTFMVQEIWVFCVPLQYSERDVQKCLKQRKIYPISSAWRMSEDMEYLELRLERSISSQILTNLEIKLGTHPCIILPKPRSESQFRQQLRKHESQLISQRPLNEQKLLKCVIDIEGVVSIVKDDYDDVERYILTFCSLQRVRKFEHRIKEVFGSEVTIEKPEEPIRFCRVEKMFGIENIINEYAEKFNKMGDYP